MTDSVAPPVERHRPGKRERLVAAAAQLVHEQGIERTTLAEIAKAADVPAGNVYYYFKTKDDVIAAVIESYVRQSKATLDLIEERHTSPKGRLKALVGDFVSRSELIAEYGCPLGTLCSEIDKRMAEPRLPAPELMRIPIEWAETQFKSLGRQDAHDLAVDLMAAYEGSALLANTLRDPKILTSAAHRLDRWIDAL